MSPQIRNGQRVRRPTSPSGSILTAPFFDDNSSSSPQPSTTNSLFLNSTFPTMTNGFSNGITTGIGERRERTEGVPLDDISENSPSPPGLISNGNGGGRTRQRREQRRNENQTLFLGHPI